MGMDTYDGMNFFAILLLERLLKDPTGTGDA